MATVPIWFLIFMAALSPLMVYVTNRFTVKSTRGLYLGEPVTLKDLPKGAYNVICFQNVKKLTKPRELFKDPEFVTKHLLVLRPFSSELYVTKVYCVLCDNHFFDDIPKDKFVEVLDVDGVRSIELERGRRIS